jgi:hypothetical protein
VFNHKEQLGFATFAINSADTDYLRLAYMQAKNIKATQKNNRYAVIVDKATAKEVTDTMNKVFDYVVELPESDMPAMSLEPYAFSLTPFKETIKLESDLLFTRSIDHWLPAFRLRDVVLSTGCKNYRGESSTVRKYRKLFDANSLPDVYNGLMYFRYSRTAAEFFKTAFAIINNWDLVRNSLIGCDEQYPSTDVLYALTAQVLGREQCTIPSLDFINFVHMKSGIQGWSDAVSWTDAVVHEQDGNMIRINNLNQYHPVHYFDKEYKYND